MSDEALMKVKTIGLSRTLGHKPCTLQDAIRHNRRSIQAEMGAVGRIDPRRSHENVILAGCASSSQVLDEASNLLARAGIDASRLRKDRVQAVEFLFSLGPECLGVDKDRYWRSCVDWLTKTCGLHVLSADLHRDEPHEHLHCLVSPVHDGTLKGGKIVEARALRKLQSSFWVLVAGPAGLKRPSPKLHGFIKEFAADTVIEHLRRIDDPACCSSAWGLFQKHIRSEPVRYLRLLNLSDDEVRQRLLSMPARVR